MQGSRWKGSTVLCRCDNEAGVAVIMARTAHDKQIRQLLLCLDQAVLSLIVTCRHLTYQGPTMNQQITFNAIVPLFSCRKQAQPFFGPHQSVLWGPLLQNHYALGDLLRELLRFLQNGGAHPSNSDKGVTEQDKYNCQTCPWTVWITQQWSLST